jgi:flagellar basal-body rod protein FlgB
MFLNNSFGKTLDIVHRTMDVSLVRRNVIANNIANSDTPNFKRTVVNFESQLGRALASEKVHAPKAAMNHEKHIPFYRPIDYRTVEPRKVLDYLSTSKNNGNNVDVEEEMMNALHNQLNYNLMVDALSSQFRQINLVLR